MAIDERAQSGANSGLVRVSDIDDAVDEQLRASPVSAQLLLLRRQSKAGLIGAGLLRHDLLPFFHAVALPFARANWR